MKRLLASTLVLAVAATALQAQDTYNNERITSTADVIGTARYVGMGGAMGALGADISAISSNPAAIGMFRRNDLSISMGALIQGATPYGSDARARYSFDQVGFVAAFRNDGGFVNLGLNFQKKANYAQSLFASSSSLNGFTQAAQLAKIYGLYDSADGTNNAPQGMLATQAYNAMIYDLESGANIASKGYDFNRLTKGNLYGLDINLSGNIHDRFYLGMTFGLDFLNYRGEQRYVEYRDGSDGTVQDYDIVSNQHVKGVGFNFKVGTIIRPIEDSPFRFSIAIETPTFYKLKQEDSFFSIASKWRYNGNDQFGKARYQYLTQAGDYNIIDSPDGNYLEFNVRSPWKFRFGIASTYEKLIAWDVEYEYSLNNQVKMGYPTSSSRYDQSTSMDFDRSMNDLTNRMMRGQHNVRVGLEVKPTDAFAIRAGYNFFSSPMKKDARLDQCIDSYALEYTLGTDYTNLSAANIFSFGLGYRWKHFYADMAYKYRMQTGDFYAFDDTYQANGSSEAQFNVTARNLYPTEVNLDRHNITFTLGVRF